MSERLDRARCTKHALLVGVPERDIDGRLGSVPGVEAMAGLLDDLGGWSITRHTGADATRDEVRRTLETMISACRAHDTCLFYFFGHGGAVRFSGLEGDLGRRVVFYLATLRPQGSSERVGVLDIEISDALARLDRICGNVTAIIDCCHAAAMVRDGPFPTIVPPAWVRALANDGEHGEHASDRPLLLAAEGHPRIVRLFGSSALRRAYATRRASGLQGLLTQGFVDVVREANLRCDRLSWDAVAHRVREWASRQRGTEEQRVVLAGPRQRLVFSRRTVPLPRSAAFIPAPTAGRGWIRAGVLQGVQVGDRWDIVDLVLDPDLAPRCAVEAEVRRVDLDGSEVVLSDPSRQPTLGAHALVRELHPRLPVVVEGLPTLEEALRSSGLLRPVASACPGMVARARRVVDDVDGAHALEILDDDGRRLWPRVSADADGLRDVIELLEDRARARRFEQSLSTASPSALRDTDLVWRWGIIGPDQEPRPLPSSPSDPRRVPRVHVDDRLWVELGHRGSTPPQWFVCVLELGIEGRLALLNTREPEGIEVVPGVPVHVGLRGHRRRQGLVCQWPSRVPPDGVRPERLIILASRRPITLANLVRLPEPDDPTALAAQGLGLDQPHVHRDAPGRPFVGSEQWTWGRIRFEVDPRPRPRPLARH